MTTSDQQLHELYLELAEIQANHGKAAEAADHFALAMYYARRMGNAAKVSACKERIVACHPTHVAAHESSAPLFFAQLLIRYPADEAAQTLSLLRRAGLATSAMKPAPATAPAVEFVAEATPAWMASPPESGPAPASFFGDLGTGSGPSVDWTAPHAARPAAHAAAISSLHLENHHLYDLGAATRPAAGRLVDDYMAKEQLFPPSKSRITEVGFWGSAIHVLGVFAILVGTSAVGFFGYELYPKLSRFDVRGLVHSLMNGKESPARAWARFLRPNEPLLAADAGETAPPPIPAGVPQISMSDSDAPPSMK